MGIKLTIDDREWRQAIAQYEAATGKDLAVILNRAARNVAFRALEFTPKADRAKIEHELRNVVGLKTHGKKRALKKPRAIYQPTNLAMLVFLKQQWRAGKNPRQNFVSAKEIEEAAAKMINRRLSSIGFLKSGWIPAIKVFAAASGQSAPTAGVKVFGTPKGDAKLAQPSDAPVAVFQNYAHGKTERGSQQLLALAGPAVEKAVTFVAQDMLAYAERKMAETAKKFSGR